MASINVENASEKIGLFGGGFDPVHRAHIKMAKLAADQLGLTAVRWIPAGYPTHKEIVTSAEHRLHMLKIALRNLKDERMVIDKRELGSDISTPSYTCETVQSLMIDFPKRRFFWILGEDQLLNFQSWKNWKWLLRNLTLAFCRRSEDSYTEKRNFNSLSRMIKKLEGFGGRVIRINIIPDKVSSSCIRRLLNERKNPLDALDYDVYEYAKKNNLYSG